MRGEGRHIEILDGRRYVVHGTTYMYDIRHRTWICGMWYMIGMIIRTRDHDRLVFTRSWNQSARGTYHGEKKVRELLPMIRSPWHAHR
jgi:hypothetical protein